MSSPDRALTAVIADDDFLVAREVVRAAEAAGLRVLGVAGDGEEAVELVRRLGPDVVILDVAMPRVGGLEAARRIHDETPTPVVMLTAYESPEIVAEAVAAGVGAYVTKPPDVPTLRRAVEIAVARHADLLELRRLNAELRRLLDEVHTLRGLLAVCSFCRRIRETDDTWRPMEEYVTRHTEVQLSHGLCPDCLAQHYPDIAAELAERLAHPPADPAR
jgi:AmiR/NasT family two-component response regulator